MIAVWKILLNIFQTSSNNSTALRMQNRGVVSIFGAGYPGCDLAAWVPNAPKMEGESKGGDLPSWHTTFGESLVCYTFCPGWRGKGAARSGAVTFPHQEIRQWDGAAAIIPLPDFGRDKRYIQPPSRRSDIANGPIIGPASHPSGRECKATYWPLVSFALGRFSKSETSPRRSSASFSRSISSPTVCKMASVT